MKPKTTTDELKAILTEQREMMVMLLAQSAFINAAVNVLMNLHPAEAKKILGLNEFHFQAVRDRLADSMRQKKLMQSLKSFLDGTSEGLPPDVFQNN